MSSEDASRETASSERLGHAREDVVAAQLQRLKQDREASELLSAYVTLLIDDAGWGVEAVAGLLGVSRQSVSNRRKQGRDLRAAYRAELAELPAPPGPARGKAADRTRSGLRIPDADEIGDRELSWVEKELGGDVPAAELPARMRLVAGVVDEADARLAELRTRRASLAWSLTCFDAKARQGLQRAGHWQPDEFFAARAQALASASELRSMDDDSLTALATARGIAPIADVEKARAEYFTVTSSLLAAQARRRGSARLRDDLVRRFVRRDENGRWKGVTEAAALIGRTQSQVTQICDG